ncbi:MAG: ferritin-like domain-containing protein [Phycisphaeraceae bacterium]|nr:ferritin-like domain-containing protein [Phycisphaeraceae bacterium]
MDKAGLIDKLNEAIALELGALLQYNQYSQVITGLERRVWHEFFEESMEESLGHARKFGSKVVALGGTPAVEPDPVKQTTDLNEMLENSLAVERRAVKIYTEALAFCEDNPAYRNLLEDQIEDEQDDVEQIEKYLQKIQAVGEKSGGDSVSKSA